MRRTVFIRLTWNGETIVIPELVENLNFERESEAHEVPILGKGLHSKPAFQGLLRVGVESQFWQQWLNRFDNVFRDVADRAPTIIGGRVSKRFVPVGVPPREVEQAGQIRILRGLTARQYYDWLEAWQKSREPARLVIESDIQTYVTNELVLCEYLNREVISGEDNDIHFSLQLVEFKPHGVKEITPPEEPAPEPPREEERPAPPRTHTVVSGDSLWGITQQFLGRNYGNRWPELYNMPENKAEIHSRSRNPNLIFPGQVFIIPPAWL